MSLSVCYRLASSSSMVIASSLLHHHSSGMVLKRRRGAAAKMVSASSGNDNVSVDFDVPFPTNYTELLQQTTKATVLALKDGKQLMEIEFPTAGLGSVPGDGEGGT
ncbi:hypothetical protein Dimus_013789 [Dionaea muscipula]